MLGQAIILIISGIILFLPLFFWMYVFSSFWHLGVSRKQFLFWLWAWALSTLPLIYSDIFVLWRLIEEIFFSLSFISSSFLGIWVLWSMSIFFLLMLTLSFLISKVILKKWEIQKYAISFWWMVCVLGVSSLLIYTCYFFFWDSLNTKSIESGDFVFIWIAWIIWYYIVISLLEEWMKHTANLNMISEKKNMSFWSMLASWAVVALGFSFFENILYAYSFISLQGVEQELLRLVFFRSFFTVALHVLCAMLVAWGFYMLYVLRGKYSKAYLLFFVFTFCAIVSHAFFDIALTFWYIGVIFIYIFFLYILVWYITNPE